MFDSKILED